MVVWTSSSDGNAPWEAVREQRTGVAGIIRVSAPADTTYQVLESVVVAVCAEHPALRVILDTSDAVKHLHGDAIDMAIRYGSLSDSTLTARKLAECPAILVASPAYLAKEGTPERPEDLSDHRCLTLQLSGEPTARWQLLGRGERHELTLDSALCGDGYLARRWAVAGMGIARKSLFDVIDDLEEGRLVHVLPEYGSEPMPIHAVFPSRRFLPARVRALDAAITTAFASRAERCRAWMNVDRTS